MELDPLITSNALGIISMGNAIAMLLMLPSAYARCRRDPNTLTAAFLNLLILIAVFVGPLALAFVAGALMH